MPPHRRRPTPSAGQAPPIRRPKVAGMRNRQPTDAAEERVEGVLNGVRGNPPKPPTDTERDTDTTVLPRITDPEPEPDPDDLAESADSVDTDDTEPDVDPETNEPPAIPERGKTPSARPAGKRRTTGTARPTDLGAAETDAGANRAFRHAGVAKVAKVQDRPTRTRAQKQLSLAIVLAVAAVLLAGAAVFFRGKADELRSGDTNTALTDSAATSQVKGQLTNAIKQTFSYNYTDLESTEKAVKENLTGKALCEYNLLFGEVKQYAPQQKIVLDTTVRELAVVRIDGDRAEALVYIDQLSTRVDVNKTVAVGGQFAVQAHRQGERWKITEFDMFGQPLFNGQPTPTC